MTVEFDKGKAENVKLPKFSEIVLRNSDVSIFSIQFHGINMKPNVEFQLSEIYIGKVKFSHDFTFW